ncbi:hypothetical protein PS15p_201686 [Mucor circinelloides]
MKSKKDSTQRTRGPSKVRGDTIHSTWIRLPERDKRPENEDQSEKDHKEDEQNAQYQVENTVENPKTTYLVFSMISAS